MIIAVPSKEEHIESSAESRFGRTKYFVIFDSEANTYSSIENKYFEAVSGAGGQTVRQLSELNVEVVLVPEIGPKALDAIKAFDIKAYRYKDISSVTNIIQLFKEDKLEMILTESHEGYHGLYKV